MGVRIPLGWARYNTVYQVTSIDQGELKLGTVLVSSYFICIVLLWIIYPFFLSWFMNGLVIYVIITHPLLTHSHHISSHMRNVVLLSINLYNLLGHIMGGLIQIKRMIIVTLNQLAI